MYSKNSITKTEKDLLKDELLQQDSSFVRVLYQIFITNPQDEGELTDTIEYFLEEIRHPRREVTHSRGSEDMYSICEEDGEDGDDAEELDYVLIRPRR